jgi:formylglycine-generating enzyme required for sulfatase activity
MIKKYFLVILIILISGCQASNQTKGDGNSSSSVGSSSSSTSFTATDNLPRLALIIGNSNYNKKADWLANPLNDAADMAAVLRGLNFKVILKQDIDHNSMKRAVNNFTQRLNREKGIGLFYFSGHGLQDNNSHNYLIPVDADISTQADIQYQAVNSSWVLDKMSETNNALNVLILDACRDKFRQQNKGYIKKGLAAMQASLGSLVAYATAPNTSDLGSERKRNSVYTQYLVRALKTRSNLSVSDMLTYVTNKVAGETNNQQIPWQSGSMKDIFCFSRCGSSEQQAAEITRIKKEQSDKIARRDAKIANLEAQLRVSKQQQTIIPTPTFIKPKPVFSNNLVAGKVFRDRLRDGNLGPKMVVIPAGSFRMGDIQGGGDSDEQPVHRVSVGKFAMGVYEVTFAEYDKFAEATGRKKPSDRDWGRGNRPVINVSWHDAVAYTKWLSSQTGKKYSLPTEAEWEYAARAGTETKYWWGNEIDKSKANYGWSFNKTSAVGSFAANQFGLYDTVGNLWEWTCSAYANKYNGKEKQCVTTGSSLSFRGGSWYGNAWRRALGLPRQVRAAGRYDAVGFRVSRLVTL